MCNKFHSRKSTLPTYVVLEVTNNGYISIIVLQLCRFKKLIAMLFLNGLLFKCINGY